MQHGTPVMVARPVTGGRPQPARQPARPRGRIYDICICDISYI